MELLAVVVILILILLYLYIKQYKSNNSRNCIPCMEKQEYMDKKNEDEGVSPIDMTNISADRGIMANSPQPDNQCYWSSQGSQNDVDALDRLNNLDFVTPLVLSRSGLYQSCACNCLGDTVGKIVYDDD